MKFNYSVNSDVKVEPEYDKPYGSVLPPVQAQGNLTYLQFIDLVNELWSRGNSEIKFGAFGEHRRFDPQLGYIIYSLEDKKPKVNNPRPKLYEIVDDNEEPFGKRAVFIENFNAIVSFIAVHQEPRTAEELIENFEDFMIEYTPIYKSLGLENISYVRRMPDSLERRFGEDVSTRSIAYMVGIQKILTIPMSKLQDAYIRAQVILSGDSATPNYITTETFIDNLHDATPSHDVNVKLHDNHWSIS